MPLGFGVDNDSAACQQRADKAVDLLAGMCAQVNPIEQRVHDKPALRRSIEAKGQTMAKAGLQKAMPPDMFAFIDKDDEPLFQRFRVPFFLRSQKFHSRFAMVGFALVGPTVISLPSPAPSMAYCSAS